MTAPSRAPRPSEHRDGGPLDADRAGDEQQPGRVAPDGQRVVDQSGEMAEEQREIRRKADLVEATAHADHARDQTARFWSSRHLQVGALLALFAGLFTLAIRTWPIAPPQGRGTVGVAWFICATLAGVLYLAGFFLADRHWRQARLILVSASLLHLAIAFLAAFLVDTQNLAPAWRSFLFDAIPAIAALVAALLISAPPGERHASAAGGRR